jgi:uncharacterized protein YjiS (DUF1127 family)
MNPEILNQSYEQIDNQILRILLYFGAVVIVALSSALAYLWQSWRAEQRERMELDKLNASALSAVTITLNEFREEVERLAEKRQQP